MALSTILAEGTGAAVSTDVIVLAGASVRVGIFSATRLAPEAVATVFIVTPGVPNPLINLNAVVEQTQFVGPGTIRVSRPQGPTLGVFLEA